jgi:hypothetical protein
VYKRISQEGATKVAIIFKNQKSCTVAGLPGVSENERFAKIINNKTKFVIKKIVSLKA